MPQGLGFRGLGFRGLGFRGLGFRVLSLPGFPLLDWLHVVGLGVAADVFDNLLAYAVAITYRLAHALWLGCRSRKTAETVVATDKLGQIKLCEPASVLDHLTEEMLKREGASKKP